MSQYLISIVIPVYNVEQFLKRCVNSVLRQSYNKLQIILVDDGSVDNSGSICDEYAQKEQRIEVYHQKNQGLSGARNTGIEHAMGEYITFIDSDDFVHETYIQRLLELCISHQCDISQCGVESGAFDFFSWDVKEQRIKKWNGKALLCGKSREFQVIACGKLYKTELFRNIRFPVGRLHEDEYVTYKVVYDSNGVVITNELLYYYYSNPNSIMRKKRMKLNYDQLNAYSERIDFFKKKGEKDLVDISRKELCIRIMLMYIENYKIFIPESKNLLEEYRKIYKKVKHVRIFSYKEKIVLQLFYYIPNLIAVLENSFKIREILKIRRKKK